MSAAACWSRTAGGWAGSGEKGKAVAGPWGSGGLLGHSGAALGRCLFFDFLAEDLFGQRTAKQKKPHQNSFFLPLSLSFCMGQPDLISLLSAYRRWHVAVIGRYGVPCLHKWIPFGKPRLLIQGLHLAPCRAFCQVLGMCWQCQCALQLPGRSVSNSKPSRSTKSETASSFRRSKYLRKIAEDAKGHKTLHSGAITLTDLAMSLY